METQITRIVKQPKEDGSTKDVAFVFKKHLTIADRQKLFAIPKREDGTFDGIEIVSVTFACYCISIDGKEYDFNSAYNWIKNLTDLDFFFSIDAEFTKIAQELEEEMQKKKTTGTISTQG